MFLESKKNNFNEPNVYIFQGMDRFPKNFDRIILVKIPKINVGKL